MRWWAALVLRAFAGLLGAALIAVATYQNAIYWHITYSGNVDFQLTFVGASLVTDALKLVIPALCAVYAVSIWRRPDALLGFTIALIISCAGGIGYQQMTKDAANAGAQHAKDAHAEIDRQVQETEAALAKLGEAGRQLVIISADLKTAESQAGRNRDGSVRCSLARQSATDECKAVAKLEAELAKEQSRAVLDPKLTQLRKEKAALPAEQKADPAAAAIGSWLRGLYIPWLGVVSITDDGVTRVLSVLKLLLLELCPAALALFVFAPPKLPVTPVDLPRAKPTSQPTKRPTTAPGAKLAPLARKSDLLELLRTANTDAHGWIDSTQEAIGDAIGCSKAHANRQIKDLVRRDLIEAHADKRGTRLRLKPRPANVVNMRP